YASRKMTTEEQYRAFGVPYDVEVLSAVPEGAVTLMHLHGDDPMFELVDEYPIQMVNWHDRETSPSLGEGKERFAKGAVVGGIGREGVMLHGTPEQVTAEVQDAIAQTGGERFVVSTGCVTMVPTPEANIRAVCDVVRGW
ncbi:MAG TPA: uroporphyrinogen decarboxylase family protein, partial [Fimbriimonadaceae bacterium]|nr:uroporphyrinogen decarboxylase family protein [Fimbriimonadaceae bacterium]